MRSQVNGWLRVCRGDQEVVNAEATAKIFDMKKPKRAADMIALETDRR